MVTTIKGNFFPSRPNVYSIVIASIIECMYYWYIHTIGVLCIKHITCISSQVLTDFAAVTVCSGRSSKGPLSYILLKHSHPHLVVGFWFLWLLCSPIGFYCKKHWHRSDWNTYFFWTNNLSGLAEMYTLLVRKLSEGYSLCWRLST